MEAEQQRRCSPAQQRRKQCAGALRPPCERGIRLEALANLAHELRTPMQVLLGYFDILQSEWSDKLAPEPRRIIGRMSINLYELAQTVENVMDFATGQAQARALVDEKIELGELLDEVAPILKAASADKKLALLFDLGQAPDAVILPRRALKLILLNLALNAIKFSADGTVTIASRRMRGSAGCGIELEVDDTGAGMDREALEQTIRPPVQLPGASRRSHRGLGLGLAVVKKNLGALGGALKLVSRPGRGSSFTASIPCSLDGRGPATALLGSLE